MKLKKIGILSVVKLSFLIMLFVGFILGILFGFASQLAASSLGLSGVSTLSIWFISLIIIPLVVSICASLICLVFSLVYNLFSQLLGGISLEFES